MYLELIGQVLAGLGLFFVGIKLLSSNMQQLASPRLRRLIVKSTSHPVIASILGAIGGVLMQKPSGVIAILSSMQAGGLITLRQAMPIIAWCNVGLAFLAFFVIIPISVFICYAIGVTGFLMMFSTKKKNTVIISAFFGAALLFYGLDVMKDGTIGLKQFDWFQQFVLYANNSSIIALFVGIIVAAISQSFIAIAFMAISLVEAGALGLPEAAMIIYGANFGVGFFRRMMTASMTGEVQQMFIYQNIFRYIGTGGSVLLFYLVRIDGTPLMLYLAQAATSSVGTQLTLIFLACNLPAVLVASFFQEPLARLLERLSPASIEDDLTKLKHLALADKDDPKDMMDRLDAELSTRTRHFTMYIDSLRPGVKKTVSPETLHHSFTVVINELSEFENELAKQQLSQEEVQRLSGIMSRQTHVFMLDDALFQIVCTIRDKINKSASSLREPGDIMLEAVGTFILILADVMDSEEKMDIDTLAQMSLDKGPVMDEFRRQYLNGQTASKADLSVLLELSNQYEHIIWIVNRITSLLAKSKDRA